MNSTKILKKNKGFLLASFLVVILISFLTIKASLVYAENIQKDFIRIKVDSTSNGCGSNCTQLWNFFATNEGTFDEFNVKDDSYNGYDCGLLLTEEYDSGDDKEFS